MKQKYHCHVLFKCKSEVLLCFLCSIVSGFFIPESIPKNLFLPMIVVFSLAETFVFGDGVR